MSASFRSLWAPSKPSQLKHELFTCHSDPSAFLSPLYSIGTTITGLLAALSTNNITVSLKIALCHTLFNVTGNSDRYLFDLAFRLAEASFFWQGILIWFPIPLLRRVPLRIASFLGNTVAEYRWFAIFYLVFVFLLVPLFLFAMSLAGK